MEKNDEVVYMTDDEIMNLKVSDLRDLTPDEKINDNLRRGDLRVLPVKEGSGLRGIATSSSLTTEKMRTYKQEN